MKILVVSLLRLGDIIQQVPLLKGLKDKYLDAEVHLLLNSQFKSAEKILEGTVDQFFYFDREALQEGLGVGNYNILWSYSELETLTHQLNENSYDKILNFTHNKLSAFLVGCLQSDSKEGLYYSDGKFQGLENPWLRYFNNNFSGKSHSLFQYVEILAAIFKIPIKCDDRKVEPTLIQTSSDKSAELSSEDLKDPVALPAKNKRSNLILFQCLTSDSKKNWGLQRFAELKKIIENCLPDHPVKILCAEFETKELLSYFKVKDLIVCDLTQAQQHLRNAALLVSVDTSIKHLGALVGTPMIEIVIGSSDANKTAAWSAQSVILKSTVACAPCLHSQPCFQKTHLCAEDIQVEKVFEAVWDQLSESKKRQEAQLKDFERAVLRLVLDQKIDSRSVFESNSIEPRSFEESEFEETEFEENKFQEIDFEIAADKLVQTFGSDEDSNADRHFWAKVSETNEQFLAWQRQAEAALPEKCYFESIERLQAQNVAALVLVVQEIVRSKKDQFGCFFDLTESLTSKFSDPVDFFVRTKTALMRSGDIIDARMRLTEKIKIKIEMDAQKGVSYAKGFGRASEDGTSSAGVSTKRIGEENRYNRQSPVQQRVRETNYLERNRKGAIEL